MIDIIVKDRKMVELLDIVHMVSETMATILITGESGTGQIHASQIYPPPFLTL